MNQQFVNWFKGSIAVDDKMQPQLFYHGTSYNFNSFDIKKIRANETDAVYNGFWFTSEKEEALPAWTKLKYLKTCYLRLTNPAPHALARRIHKDVIENIKKYSHYDSSARSICDIVRYELQFAGYDGIIHEDAVKPNLAELQSTGKTVYRTARGRLWYLEVDKVWGGLNLLNCDGELITGYTDYADFMNQHKEKIYVVFDPKQIYVLKSEEIKL
ncbi:hypothetical protein D3C71_1449470 [compost metagenome]